MVCLLSSQNAWSELELMYNYGKSCVLSLASVSPSWSFLWVLTISLDLFSLRQSARCMLSSAHVFVCVRNRPLPPVQATTSFSPPRIGPHDCAARPQRFSFRTSQRAWWFRPPIPTAAKWSDGQVFIGYFLQTTQYRLHNSMVGLMSCERENIISMKWENAEGSSCV